jgi:hypothetical protein
MFIYFLYFLVILAKKNISRVMDSHCGNKLYNFNFNISYLKYEYRKQIKYVTVINALLFFYFLILIIR